jgi:hypothetical protein
MKYLTDKILKHRNHLEDSDYISNYSYDFIPSDSEKLWLENLKKNNHSIQYYKNNPIEYKLNNEGFRTPDDFNSEDEGNIFLGCSHTFGIGHHLENIWSYKLNNIIGGKFWNLGIGGTGTATHFRLLLGFYKQLRIKNIFHYAPMYPRYEFIENSRPQNYIVSDYNESWIPKLGDLMSDSLLTKEEMEMNWIRNTNAIKGLASEIGINYYLIEGSDKYHGNEDGSLQARDLLHHTTLFHHKIYQSFLKLYDEELYNQYSNQQEPITNIKTFIKSQKNSIL